MKKALITILAFAICIQLFGIQALSAQVRDLSLASDEFELFTNTGDAIEALYEADYETYDERVIAITEGIEEIWGASGLNSVITRQQFDILRSYIFPHQIVGFVQNSKDYELCFPVAQRYAEGVEFDLIKLIDEKGFDAELFRTNMTAYFQIYLFKGLEKQNAIASAKDLNKNSMSDSELLELYRSHFSVELEEMMYFTINNSDKILYERLVSDLSKIEVN